jgi:hypothetical protein
MAFGGGGAVGFAVILRAEILGLSPGVFGVERDSLNSREVAAVSLPVSLSSSSNDSLLFARDLFFFFGGPSDGPLYNRQHLVRR